MAVGGDGGGGAICIDFMAINSHEVVTWQANGWWVVVRRWETAQGAGGAYLATFGVETMVMWHRKWATTGVMVLAGLQTSWGLVVTHLVSLGCVLLAFMLTIVSVDIRKPKTVVFVSRHKQEGGGNLHRGVNGIGWQHAQWRG